MANPFDQVDTGNPFERSVRPRPAKKYPSSKELISQTRADMKRGIGLTARAIGEGLSDAFGLVANPINYAISKTGLFPYRDYSENTRALLTQAGVPLPQGNAEELSNRAARALVSSAPFIKTGQIMAQSGKPLVNKIGETLAMAPKSQAAGNVAASLATDATRLAGAPVPVQVASGLVAGALVPGGANTTGEGADYLRRKLTGEDAQEAVGALLRDNVVDVDMALQNIDNFTPQISGAMPTLAEVTRDSGLAGLQRGLGNIGTQGGGLLSGRLQSNAQTRLGAIVEQFGQGNPQALQDFALDASQRANQRVNQAISSIGPAAYADDTGSAARTLINDAYDAARVRTNRAYNAPELLNIQPVNVPKNVFDDMMASADAFYGDGGGVMPEELRGIIDDLAASGATTRTLTNIDRRLADFAGSARVAGRGREAGFAESLRNRLNDFAQGPGGMSPEQQLALANAKAARRAQGEIFETGAVGKVTSTGKFGNTTIPDSAVPQKLFPKGRFGSEATRQFIAAVGPDQAEAVARQEVRRLLDGSNQNVGSITKIMGDYEDAMRAFPGVQADLEAALRHARSGEGLARSPLGRLADNNINPTDYIGQLLGRKDGGRSLRTLANQAQRSGEGMNGMRRAMAEHLDNVSRTTIYDANDNPVPANIKMLTTLDGILKNTTGTAVLSSSQRQIMERLRSELAGAQFAATANRTTGSDTIRNTGIGAQLLKWGARQAAGGNTLYDVLLNTMDNTQSIHALAIEALLDPKLAADLMRKPTPQRWQALQQRLGGGATGSVIGTSITTD